MDPAAPPSGVSTLGAVIDALGAGVVRVVTAPRGLAVPVGELVVHDLLAEPSVGPATCCSRPACSRSAAAPWTWSARSTSASPRAVHVRDVRQAAEATGVHPNTFRYRLRRLLELAELDLDDPQQRLVVQLPLHLLAP